MPWVGLPACGDIREVPVEGGDGETTVGTGTEPGSEGTGGSSGLSGGSGSTTQVDRDTDPDAADSGASSTGATVEMTSPMCTSAPASIDVATGKATLSLDVTGVGEAIDVDVLVRLHHDAVGRVELRLERDSGGAITLFPELGRTDCTPDLSVRFDADGELDAQQACEGESVDGLDLAVVPLGDLRAILDGEADDTWRVVVTDVRDEPSGELLVFCLSFATGA